MPCFEIERPGQGHNPSLESRGIMLRRSDRPEIVVGSTGRSRKQVIVPLPEGSEIQDNMPYNRLVVSVPSSTDDGTILVLIRDQSGFRGGWELTAPRPEAEYDTIVMREALQISEEDAQRLYPVPPRSPHTLLVVAEGRCAQGEAGNMGGGPELLIKLRPGEAAEIVRWGRLYGAARSMLLAFGPEGPTLRNPRMLAAARQAAARL